MTRVLRVFADANILYSRILRDYVLYADVAGAIRVRWTDEVLEETTRNLIRTNKLGGGLDQQQNADLLVMLMRDHFPLATVSIDPLTGAIVDAIDMDAKDRHVLAGALSAEANVLLTENDKHFPRVWMAANGIELLTAGRFLELLASEYPDELAEAHRLTVANLQGADDFRVIQRLNRAVGQRHGRAVRAVAAAVGIPTAVVELAVAKAAPLPTPRQGAAAEVSMCGYPMPRAKQPCVLSPGHRGHHRSKLPAR